MHSERTSAGPRALNDDNFRHRVFRPAVRRTKLTGFRFHDLRHTYAALMVAAGASTSSRPHPHPIGKTP